MSSPTEPLLSLRAAVILLCSLLIAIAVGGLTYLTAHNIAAALIACGTGFGTSALWLNTIIGH